MLYLNSECITNNLDDVIRQDVEVLTEAGVTPTLVGLEGLAETPSHVEISKYTQRNIEFYRSLGMNYVHRPVGVYDLHREVDKINADENIHGGMVYTPLDFPDLAGEPDSREKTRLRTGMLLDTLDPQKAVDGQGSQSEYNTGATSDAGVRLPDEYGFDGFGANVLVLGHLGTVGSGIYRHYSNRPVKDLQGIDGDPEKKTDEQKAKELKIIKAADIIVVATGSPSTVTSDMTSPGQVLVGIGRRDLDKSVYEDGGHLLAVTPREGGVGPLTQRILARRLVRSAQLLTKPKAA